MASAIAAFRKKHNLTRADIGATLNISVRTVFRREQGDVAESPEMEYALLYLDANPKLLARDTETCTVCGEWGCTKDHKGAKRAPKKKGKK